MLRSLINLFLLLLFTSFNVFADLPEADLGVSIDEEIQATIDLKTTLLKSSLFQEEITSFATLVNLAPLFKQRSQYYSHKAHYQIAQLHVQQSKAIIKRLKNLASNQAVSSRKLLAQQNQFALYLAELKASKNTLQSLHKQFIAQWGATLTQWALSDNNKEFQSLSQFNQQIYLSYLPAKLLTPPQTIYLHPSNYREQAHKAQLISNAPHYAHTLQAGSAFFYLSDNVSHSPFRLNAWLPTQKQAQKGVIIPQSALVWHLGQSFVYLQTDDEHFNRIAINPKIRSDSQHYFITDQLRANDRLVIQGAQVLLSEEFRGQIPAEDDDDDDD